MSIVIVNYRTPQYIIGCLETLLPELEGISARVVIVDNNSEDDSPAIIQDWLSKHDPNNYALIVRAGTNSGFSGGNNIGIKALKAHYYLLLNSDTLILEGAINMLLDTAKECPGAGLISPWLEGLDGVGQENCFHFHHPVSEFCSSAQTGLLNRLLKKYVVAMPVRSELENPEWTCFACVLIKDAVFGQVGLLDERYFMYFEDVEFCRRARNAGWDIVYQPESRVVHIKGGSSPVQENLVKKKRLPRYYYESRTLYFYNTYGWWGLTFANLLWEAGRLISKTRQLLGRSDKAAIENQWLDIWINWLTPNVSIRTP